MAVLHSIMKFELIKLKERIRFEGRSSAEATYGGGADPMLYIKSTHMFIGSISQRSSTKHQL